MLGARSRETRCGWRFRTASWGTRRSGFRTTETRQCLSQVSTAPGSRIRRVLCEWFGGARTPSRLCYRSLASASQCGGCGTEEGDVGAPRSHDTARSVERQLRVTRPTHRKLIAALALSCLPTTGIVAQSPLIGFWVRNAVHCASRTGPRCAAVLPWSGSWAPQLAIDVRGDTVLVSGPNNAFTQHVDTFMVDGRINRWLPGRRGFVRATTEPPERYGVGPPVSRPLLPGESWRASSDGRTLTHTVQRKAGADSISVTMTYRRLAG